jgi:hypothetical protein
MNTYKKQQKEWKSKTEIMVSFDIRKRFPFNGKEMITHPTPKWIILGK